MDLTVNNPDEEIAKNANGGGETALHDIAKIYNMLEDSQSKDIFLKRLNYLITGDFQYIRDIVTAYTPHLVPWSSKDFGTLLASMPQDRGYVLYGAGRDAAMLIDFYKDDKRFVGFCANDREKQKTGYLGWPVMSPEELLSRKDLSVVVSTREARYDILCLLEERGYPSDLVYDGPAFYGKYSTDTEQYFNPDFMTFEEEEVFVDAGCFNLQSSLKLRKYCSRVKKVYAFEPDPQNYETCMRAKELFHFPQVKIFPYGTWSKKTTLRFYAMDHSGSAVCEVRTGKEEWTENTVEVPVMTIDEAIEPGDRVTMIKMDIEGAELEALKGAKQTIQRDKPKLAICVYHEMEDILTIPMYIKELVPEYRLYIRHHANTEGETVLYAMMPRQM